MMVIEQRKQKEAEFHDKVRDEALKKDTSKYQLLTVNKKFYSIVRGSQNFVNNWLFQKCQNKRVLDYCCGNGETTIFLAKNGAKAVGIDISNVSIENAQKKAIRERVDKNTSFFVMDAERLEFKNNYFDIIICCGVLHHLDIAKAYPELARVLKPKGEAICIEPLAYNPVFQLYRKMTPNVRTRWEMEHILTKREIELAKKHFGRVETKFFHLFTLLAVPFRNLPIFSFVLRPLEIIDSLILKLPLIKWLSWQIIFVLSKPKETSH